MSFKSLIAYQKSFSLAMEIFTITKNFPSDEKFALTSQIVRSSRGVCSAIAEAYRKREYVKHFKSKLTDADSENCRNTIMDRFCIGL